MKEKSQLKEHLDSNSKKESFQKNKIVFYNNSVLDKILKWDYRSLLRIYDLDPKLTKPLKIISFFGTFQFWLVFTSVIYLLGIVFAIEGYYYSVFNFGALLFSGIFGSFFTMTLLKWVLKRKRPFANDNLKKYLGEDIFQKIKNRDPKFGKRIYQSFPSGHVGYWMMEMLFFQYQFGNWVLIPFLIIIPFMIIARIHFGVHFPIDIICGLILGLLTGYIVILMFHPILMPIYNFLFNLIF